MALKEFDDIRPYNDEEFEQKLKELLQDPEVDRVLSYIFKDLKVAQEEKKKLGQIETRKELQSTFIKSVLDIIISKTTQGLECSGLENLDKTSAYLFVSNHRDIILDAAFLNYIILSNEMNTTQIAIGDNLLIYDWITKFVKLNQAFVVRRGISARELLESSMKMSAYIRRSITQDNQSVWIAQREGRTKNGDDKTQKSMLKMLNKSNIKSLAEGFGELKIIPLSISYEIEPCGVEKVEELIKKEREGYQKTTMDDLTSMAKGIFDQKGKVHFSFGKPILQSFLKGNNNLTVNAFIDELATRIDHRIHQYCRLWPCNYVAYEMQNGTGEFSDCYSSADVAEFKNMIAGAQLQVGFSPDEVAQRFTTMYAKPVENFLIACDVFR
ncbi:MAG: 1-acyl-sn-glycerol-3-phosphate acyltransferase [Prolixibacteraceae bacterium]|nr:1-acyl-sn-glycerol-3-phosphate acyltransferase [Prolixibacteraceae bacterium]